MTYLAHNPPMSVACPSRNCSKIVAGSLQFRREMRLLSAYSACRSCFPAAQVRFGEATNGSVRRTRLMIQYPSSFPKASLSLTRLESHLVISQRLTFRKAPGIVGRSRAAGCAYRGVLLIRSSKLISVCSFFDNWRISTTRPRSDWRVKRKCHSYF